MTVNPYKVLGLSRQSSAEEIKTKFRKLARENHPDRHPDDKTAENRFKDISNAYGVLGDPEQRRKFDAGEVDGAGHARAPEYPQHSHNSNAKKPRKSPFDYIFKDRGPVKAKGADVTYTLKVSVSEAINGANTSILMTSGKTLKVRLPAGTQSGQILRLKGQGMNGLGMGKAGDALVEIQFHGDSTFRTEGANVYSDEPVTLSEALFGARIEVNTAHGRVMVNVPEDANTGTKLRLKGRGIKVPGNPIIGDHYVTLKVVLPKVSNKANNKGNNEELKSIVKKWAEKNPYTARVETLSKHAAE